MRVLVATCLLTVVLFTLGCGGIEREEQYRQSRDRQSRAEIINFMNLRKGKMSYDDALHAMGPPTRATEGANVFVAIWEKMDIKQDPGDTAYGIYGNRVDVPGAVTTNVERTTFWFNPKTKLMTNWRLELCSNNVCQTFP